MPLKEFQCYAPILGKLPRPPIGALGGLRRGLGPRRRRLEIWLGLSSCEWREGCEGRLKGVRLVENVKGKVSSLSIPLPSRLRTPQTTPKLTTHQASLCWEGAAAICPPLQPPGGSVADLPGPIS